jgi:hypothetical protein
MKKKLNARTVFHTVGIGFIRSQHCFNIFKGNILHSIGELLYKRASFFLGMYKIFGISDILKNSYSKRKTRVP